MNPNDNTAEKPNEIQTYYCLKSDLTKANGINSINRFVYDSGEGKNERNVLDQLFVFIQEMVENNILKYEQSILTRSGIVIHIEIIDETMGKKTMELTPP